MPDSDDARIEALLKRMERFACGEDCSLAAAGNIEGEIARIFDEDDEFQELAEYLAQYRPEGGDFLYSQAEARPEMARWCEVLRRRLGDERRARDPA